uniref:Uncharacterized protein n=1 Tax=Pseudomonas phage HRDY3 TaxID=3236930 RepID=A0AB39CEF9_9VIRU
MPRALFVWIICVSITVVAVCLSHIGILTFGIWSRYQGVMPEMFWSVVAAAVLPLFFLSFLLICCTCLFVWSVKRLFQRSANLPDFM